MLIRDYFCTFRRSFPWIVPNPWLVLTLVLSFLAVYGSQQWQEHRGEELSGGSTLRLWYGIFAAGLMFFAFLILPIQRRRVLRPGKPSRWRPTRAFWLQAHVWLSLLATVLILYHAGLQRSLQRSGHQLGSALLVVYLLTIATGLWGLVCQQVLPRWITKTIVEDERLGRLADPPAAQVAALCKRMEEQAASLFAVIRAELVNTRSEAVGKAEQAYQAHVQPLLHEQAPWRLAGNRSWRRASAALVQIGGLSDQSEVRAAVRELEAIVAERRRFSKQESWYWWLHAWLFVHVPLAVAALLLCVVHAVACLAF
jgi:hypothetical protein